MRAWIFATRNRAFFRFADPFFFLANARWALANFFSYFANAFGPETFSPVEAIAKCVNPKSMPILPSLEGKACTVSSHCKETKYRSAASLLMVMVVTCAALDRVLYHRMFRSPSSLAIRNV